MKIVKRAKRQNCWRRNFCSRDLYVETESCYCWVYNLVRESAMEGNFLCCVAPYFCVAPYLAIVTMGHSVVVSHLFHVHSMI